uniref:Uncharacterized protein n=1 Tax=Globisporangium ultimum (strain ATCC 200006 / CBS 805.95 / DAOM BR144) TaxID=431595 RepID=K3X970_GLOUD
MGQGGSNLVDCVCDGDIQGLKSKLQQRKKEYNRLQFIKKNRTLASNNHHHQSNNNDNEDGGRYEEDEALAELVRVTQHEVEDAMHAVVSMEIHSAQQFQQAHIALELLFQAQPSAWSSTVSNASIQWTAAHRACVTGNLSFLTFVFQRFDAFDTQSRDVYGLFPIDLVPPELLRTPEQMANDAKLDVPLTADGHKLLVPATARTRRNLALQILRQKKQEAEAQAIFEFMYHEHPSQRSSSSSQSSSSSGASPEEEEEAHAHEKEYKKDDPDVGNNDNNDTKDTTEEAPEAHLDNQHDNDGDGDTVRIYTNGYFVAFEPCNDRLVASTATPTSQVMGNAHERSSPLRLKYRVPRVEEFLHGYFQLIWRDGGATHPRSDKPNYDAHVLMRDEMFLDSQCYPRALDKVETRLHPHLQLQGDQDAANDGLMNAMVSPLRRRQLEDQDPVLEGCFPFDVSHLPRDAVCHVLFVACDKHLMKRTVVLSTEGIALRDANGATHDEVFDTLEEDGDENEDDEDDEQLQHELENGYVFYVGGEPFAHRNVAFAEQSFADIDEFEEFVKALRSRPTAEANKDSGSRNANDDQLQHRKEDALRQATTSDDDASATAAREAEAEIRDDDNQPQHEVVHETESGGDEESLNGADEEDPATDDDENACERS